MFTLYIEENQAHWLAADGSVAHGTLGEAADAAQQADVLVLVPAETILLTEVDLPPIRQPARRLNAARYTLEDQLAARVDTLHFALGDKKPSHGGATTLAITDLERMQVLMETLSDAGLNPARVAPDVLALPRPEDDEWQVCALGERILARTGHDTGFACEQSLWPALAMGARRDTSHVVIQADDNNTAASLAESEIPGTPRIERRPIEPTDALIAQMLTHADARVSLNLCQGEFARRSNFQRWWEPFKLTAALAAVVLILLLGTRAIESWQLHNRIEALHERSIAAFQAAFPGVSNINNMRAQAKVQIARLRRDGGGNAGVLALLQATARATATMEGLSLQTLQYRDGKLILSLEGKSVQAVEALRAGFENQPGVKMQVERADAAGGGVQIRASVQSA